MRKSSERAYTRQTQPQLPTESADPDVYRQLGTEIRLSGIRGRTRNGLRGGGGSKRWEILEKRVRLMHIHGPDSRDK